MLRWIQPHDFKIILGYNEIIIYDCEAQLWHGLLYLCFTAKAFITSDTFNNGVFFGVHETEATFLVVLSPLKIFGTFHKKINYGSSLIVKSSWLKNVLLSPGLKSWRQSSPLKASMTFWSVSIEIPEYPLARTLILRASSILVFWTLRGCPTPAAWDRIRFSWSSLK